MAHNAVRVTYSVMVDWDGDGYAGYDDITAYLIGWDSKVGFADPDGCVAYIGTLSMRLNNADKRFSPNNTSGPYYGKLLVGKPVRVQVTEVGGSTWTVFTGKAFSFDPRSGFKGTRECDMVATDLIDNLQAAGISLPLQTIIQADTLIKNVVNAALLAPVAGGYYTVSGLPAVGGTITIGSNVYKFVNSVSAPGDIKIGVDMFDQMKNVTAAINLSSGAGTLYGNNTPRCAIATAQGNACTGVDSSRANITVALNDAGAITKIGQGFMVDTAYPVNYIYLWLNKVGSPNGSMMLRVESDSGFQTSAALVQAGAWGNFPESFVNNGQWTQFQLQNTWTPQPGVIYWLTLSTTRNQDASNYITWGADNTTPYNYAFMPADGGGRKFVGSWSPVNGSMCFIAGEPKVYLTATMRGAIGNTYSYSAAATGIAAAAANLTGGADYPASPAPSLQAGRQVFDIAADQWSLDKGTNAMTALADIVKAEGGYLWVARNGTLTFKNRDFKFLQVAQPPLVTYSSEHNDVTGILDDQSAVSEVQVSYVPRVAINGGVVAKNTSTIRVPGLSGSIERWNHIIQNPGGGTASIRLPFTDPATGQRMAVSSIITPLVAGTDYTVGLDSAGTIDNWYTYTWTGLTISVAYTATEAIVTFKNTALGPVYVSNLQIRGTGLVAYNPVNIVVDNPAASRFSVHKYDMALPVSENYAMSLANYLLGRYKTRGYRLRQLIFNGQNKINGVNLFSLEIGDVISVYDAQVGLSALKYWIAGIEYGNLAPRDTGSITLDLIELSDLTYWILGDATYGVLGSTTRLAV